MPTEILFHVNVADACLHACGYVRKAEANARKVAVLGNEDDLRRIDAALWEGPRAGFLSHCVAGAASPAMLAASAVVLGRATSDFPHRDILLNLSGRVPEGFEDFERVVEIVERRDDALHASRQRWKFYRERKHALQSIDMLQLAGARREVA